MKRSKIVTSPPKRKFASPMTVSEIEKAKQSAVPKSTRADTDYCFRIWNEWRENRVFNYGDSIPSLQNIPEEEVGPNLSSFIFEVRKQNGSEFPPDTLHHIVSGLQRYLRWNGRPGIDLYKDAIFADFRRCLDAEMKRLQKAGLGSEKKQAEPLTAEEEELLWTKGLLGCHSPQALVDSMVFMNGMYFALVVAVNIVSFAQTHVRYEWFGSQANAHI